MKKQLEERTKGKTIEELKAMIREAKRWEEEVEKEIIEFEIDFYKEKIKELEKEEVKEETEEERRERIERLFSRRTPKGRTIAGAGYNRHRF